jgi:hypothetical protein
MGGKSRKGTRVTKRTIRALRKEIARQKRERGKVSGPTESGGG